MMGNTRTVLPPRDSEGYLRDPEDWSVEVMQALAAESGITLSNEQLHVVDFVRRYFEENQTVPEARAVLKFLKRSLGPELATRKYLYKLFPFGYAQQACKYAGMRKPLKLMLDV